jgi:hypothetical protein
MTFNPETTEFLLFEATVAHQSLAGYVLPETFGFGLWFILRHADTVVPAGAFKDMIGKLDLRPAVADHAGMLAAIDGLRVQYGEHIPALPWEVTASTARSG